MLRCYLVVLTVVAFMTLSALPAQAADEPAIAAAADLNFALTEIADLFARETKAKVKLSFGSSGNYARQIAEGAPFQLFLSADEGYVRFLAERGRTDGEGALYAVGRIALFVRAGGKLSADATLADLKVALDDGRLRRFAIANPEHAPYGRAAREALQHAGLWERIQPKLVFGENASQAAQFAASGSAEGGIVPYSLALSPALAVLGTSVLLPAAWHAPLNQRMVLIKGAGETARHFYAFVQEPMARGVLSRYGFVLPDATH
jgi:molybdate transport system substrate-binding protein